MTEKTENSISDIRAFLTDPEHPLKDGEFKEFWQSLTEVDKIEFKTMELLPQK